MWVIWDSRIWLLQYSSWNDRDYEYKLDIPKLKWEHLTIDFIIGLPPIRGKHDIWVNVDRLMKSVLFILVNMRSSMDVFTKRYKWGLVSLARAEDKGVCSMVWGPHGNGDGRDLNDTEGPSSLQKISPILDLYHLHQGHKSLMVCNSGGPCVWSIWMDQTVGPTIGSRQPLLSTQAEEMAGLYIYILERERERDY